MRDRILKAAAQELTNRSVKFTMSDLARQLSTSKTSLYEHFSSKNELIRDILVKVISDIHEQEEVIYNNPDLTIAEKVAALLKVAPTAFGPIHNHRVYDDLQHYYPTEFQIVEQFRNEQLDRFISLIIQGMSENTVRPVDTRVLRQIVASAMSDLFTYRFLAESNLTFPDALAAMSDIVVHGLIPKNT